MAACIVRHAWRYAIYACFVGPVLSLLNVTEARADCIDDAAAYHHVNPALAHAIAAVESRFSPVARHVNSNGSEDIGLMQVNSVWFPTLARFGISRAALFDGCTNAYIGVWILSQKLSQYGLTWNGVGAYNSATPSKRLRYARRIYSALIRLSQGTEPVRSRGTSAISSVPSGSQGGQTASPRDSVPRSVARSFIPVVSHEPRRVAVLTDDGSSITRPGDDPADTSSSFVPTAEAR
ncbi:lytic transglycosylase domain-containing protein [Paraburkholderia megapolitana]|uniref:lytic transglycosylase domain-containing protein n=1 Tax=Paraburkholderia megapolitana TaxID=420953 RepID=UPI0038B8D669